MAAQVSQQRLDWMMFTLVDKIIERGGNPQARIKTLLKRFDLDGSGELETDEFRDCLEDFLHGLSDAEFDALAQRFDADGSGSVSVAEFTDALQKLARQREDAPVEKPRDGAPKSTTRRSRAPLGSKKVNPDEFDVGGAANDADVEAFFHTLRLRGKRLAAVARAAEHFAKQLGGETILEDKLLRRSLDRHRSTTKATHLTVAQLDASLSPFENEAGDLFEAVTPAQIWTACGQGSIAEVLLRFARADARKASSAPSVPRKIVKLRNLLLDKFDGMGGNLRVNVRRTLSKYDVDGSGELERAECVSALQGLLNAIQPDEIADLIDDIDTDKSQTLTVDEITAYLLAAQDGRDPQDTSLKLAKKKVAR